MLNVPVQYTNDFFDMYLISSYIITNNPNYPYYTSE